MLVSNKQLEAISGASKERFIDRMASLLKAEFGDAASMPDQSLRAVLKTLISKAQGYGLIVQANIAKYIIVAFLMGEQFDTDFNRARKILSNKGFSENLKMEALQEWTLLVFEQLEG